MSINLWNYAFLCTEVWIHFLSVPSSDKGKVTDTMHVTVPGISIPGTWQDNLNNVYALHTYIFSTFLYPLTTSPSLILKKIVQR